MECCKHCNMNNPCVYLTLKGGDQRNECSAVQNEKRIIDKAWAWISEGTRTFDPLKEPFYKAMEE